MLLFDESERSRGSVIFLSAIQSVPNRVRSGKSESGHDTRRRMLGEEEKGETVASRQTPTQKE